MPQALREAFLREEPESNGDYADVASYKTDVLWYSVEPASGSDYGGGILSKTNYEVLQELLDEEHPSDTKPAVWALVSYAHRGFGIVVDWDKLDDDIQDAIGSLDEYPLLSEDRHSELMLEAEQEAWSNWARGDFEREMEKRFEIDDFPAELDSHVLFGEAAEAANEYWEDTSEGIYVNVDRVAKAAEQVVREDPDLLKAFVPEWKQSLVEIQAHRRQIGQPPLDPESAGWSDKDVVKEARRIRQLNPTDIERLRRLHTN